MSASTGKTNYRCCGYTFSTKFESPLHLCRRLGHDQLLDIYFPFQDELRTQEANVHVPFWDGCSSIVSVRRVHPHEFPVYPLPEGYNFPGEEVPPQEESRQFYHLAATDIMAYQGAVDYHESSINLSRPKKQTEESIVSAPTPTPEQTEEDEHQQRKIKELASKFEK